MMKQNEYNINTLSKSRLITVMFLILILSSIIIATYTPSVENKFLVMSAFFLIYVIAFYIASFIATAKTKVLLTKEGIHHIWKRRFFLSWEKDITIAWDNVDNYEFKNERGFDSIIINLKTNMKYKIDKLNILPMTDDFRKLKNDLPKLSHEDWKNNNNVD